MFNNFFSYFNKFISNCRNNFWIEDLDADFKTYEKALEYYKIVWQRTTSHQDTPMDRYIIRKNNLNYLGNCLQSLGYFSFILVSFDAFRGTWLLKILVVPIIFLIVYNIPTKKPWTPDFMLLASFFGLLWIYYSFFSYNFYFYFYLVVFYTFVLKDLLKNSYYYLFMLFQKIFRPLWDQLR